MAARISHSLRPQPAVWREMPKSPMFSIIMGMYSQPLISVSPVAGSLVSSSCTMAVRSVYGFVWAESRLPRQ